MICIARAKFPTLIILSVNDLSTGIFFILLAKLMTVSKERMTVWDYKLYSTCRGYPIDEGYYNYFNYLAGYSS